MTDKLRKTAKRLAEEQKPTCSYQRGFGIVIDSWCPRCSHMSVIPKSIAAFRAPQFYELIRNVKPGKMTNEPYQKILA